MSLPHWKLGMSVFWLLAKILLIVLLIRSDAARFIYQNF